VVHGIQVEVEYGESREEWGEFILPEVVMWESCFQAISRNEGSRFDLFLMFTGLVFGSGYSDPD
jgi:hypothetical protein